MRKFLLLLFSVSLTTSLFADSTGNSEIIIIPVVVHILYNTATQNISDAQVRSQLAVLNKDFNSANNDINKVPEYFKAHIGEGGFAFQLSRVDPQGYETIGIIRKHTNVQLFGTDDRMKFSSKGGDNAWDRNRYLNIWICNMAGGIAGYTSTISSPPEKDGVVIHFNVFGTTGTVSPQFNLGRTATHEIGHWLNLRHIWGDAYCGDDGVDDTPKQRASNSGCPQGKKLTCETTGDGDMYMNFMDLTNDACMYMFSKGQVKRMRALFAVGGFRSRLLFSNAVFGTPLPATTEAVVEDIAMKSNAQAYPNPAGATITIEINGIERNANTSIVLYNTIGLPVITQAITGDRTIINISHLKAGVYFARWADGMIKFVKK